MEVQLLNRSQILKNCETLWIKRKKGRYPCINQILFLFSAFLMIIVQLLNSNSTHSIHVSQTSYLPFFFFLSPPLSLYFSLSRIHSYAHVRALTHCDKEIWRPNIFGRQQTMIASKNQRTIVVSGIMKRKTVSLDHPLNHCRVMWAWEDLTLYYPCVCRRGGRSSAIFEQPAKKSTRGEFSIYGR